MTDENWNQWENAPAVQQPARNEASYEQWPDTRPALTQPLEEFQALVCAADGTVVLKRLAIIS